jgi:hypothetical protein
MQGVQEQRALRRKLGLCFKCGNRWNPGHKFAEIRAAEAEEAEVNAVAAKVESRKSDDGLMDSLKEMMRTAGQKGF